MKKQITIAAVLLAFALLPVAADVLGLVSNPQIFASSATGPIPNGVTKGTTALATNCTFYVAGKDACIQWKASLNGTGSSDNTMLLQVSVDGLYWANYTSLAMTPNGATAVTVVSNLTVNAFPYVRIYSITVNNSNTGNGTNQTVKCFVK